MRRRETQNVMRERLAYCQGHALRIMYWSFPLLERQLPGTFDQHCSYVGKPVVVLFLVEKNYVASAWHLAVESSYHVLRLERKTYERLKPYSSDDC